MKPKYYLYVSILSIFLFFFLSIFIINGNNIFYDAPIYHFVSSFPLKNFFLFVTKFGDWLFLLISLCIALVFIRDIKDRKFLTLTMALEMILNLGLKMLFKRERPLSLSLILESGYSFPSGHAMASTTFYLLLVYLIWKSKLSKILKVIFTVLFLFLIFSICLSRIYLGVHYASDILGGMLLGISLVSFGVFVTRSLN